METFGGTPLLLILQFSPWSAERKMPLAVLSRMSWAPEPFGTASRAKALGSVRPLVRCVQLPPPSSVRHTWVSPANRDVPPEPLGIATNEWMLPPLGPLV